MSNGERLRIPERHIRHMSDEELLRIVTCSSFRENYDVENISLEQNYHRYLNPETKAWQKIKEGYCTRKSDSTEYKVFFSRDLDNLGVKFVDKENHCPILYLNFRDRKHDGSLNATSPFYLNAYGDPNNPIPKRSNYIGGTNWYYSSKEYDTQFKGRKSVEFSIISSDPCSYLSEKLLTKKAKLLIDPLTLCHFIDDPFRFIPNNPGYKAMMDNWYLMWWQVVNRGLRGKNIPLPGQTSETGFKGFFREIIQNCKEKLPKYGYTHMSGVPTWGYVWRLNILNGFLSDNNDLHMKAVNFFRALDSIKLPSNIAKKNNTEFLGDLDDKDPLKSWYAVMPFILKLNPDYCPNLQIEKEYQQNFNEAFSKIRESISINNEVLTYPLEPGKNLWHSLKLT